jgi:hypothetical protein
MKHALISALVVLLAALAGCNNLLDPYAAAWGQLSVGDSRGNAQRLMGDPNSVQAVEIPLVKLEQASWRTPSGRVYLIHFALDRVVAKSVID